jgi:DNA-binding response OmpR family regulator
MHQSHPHCFIDMSYAGVVMPGNQPNMPCTHYQQLSRHKSFRLVRLITSMSFSLRTLVARMEAVLRRSCNDLSPLFNKCSFNNGDLEIDFESRIVMKNKNDAKLTPNEFKIRTALIKYPQKVFTREELIKIALGDDFEGYDRAIDSHIKNIRRKIEKDPKNPEYLRTVHGVGYKFGGE